MMNEIELCEKAESLGDRVEMLSKRLVSAQVKVRKAASKSNPDMDEVIALASHVKEVEAQLETANEKLAMLKAILSA